MIIRLALAAGLAASFVSPAAFAATSKEKMETCTFGADDQKLTGAKRKAFLSKCMSNADSPRGKATKPSPQ
jgi:psiF repeat